MIVKYKEYITLIEDTCFYIYFSIVNFMFYCYMKLVLIYLPDCMFSTSPPVINIKKLIKDKNKIEPLFHDILESESDSDSDDTNLIPINYSIFIINAFVVNNDKSEEILTHKLHILMGSDGILNIPTLKYYFPDIKYFNIIYMDSLDEVYKRKSIDINERFDKHNNVKCSFGKIIF